MKLSIIGSNLFCHGFGYVLHEHKNKNFYFVDNINKFITKNKSSTITNNHYYIIDSFCLKNQDSIDIISDLISTGARIIIIASLIDSDFSETVKIIGVKSIINASLGKEHIKYKIDEIFRSNHENADIFFDKSTHSFNLKYDKSNLSLTPRENQITKLILKGMLNKNISFYTGIQEATIRSHTRKIMNKLKVKTKTQLIILLFSGRLFNN
ncbi:helix-turn-helix domain-containing protein [Amphritea sp. HPY]|uniref:helix-turn-helix domain-containing protein n=1 Tax=Amphritea sp. HPY TaxID=3421652 RepID=UPI003D7C7DDC